MSHVEMRYARRAVVVCLVVVVFVFGAVAAASPTPVARIVTGIGPCGLHSAFGSVWVAGYGTGRLVRIDPQRNRVVRRTKIARGICHVASGPGFLWVASDVTDIVYRIAWRSGRVVGRTAVGRWPADLEVAFGWDLGPPVFMNRTRPAEAPASLRQRIADDNLGDQELYLRAVEVWRARH